MTIKNKSEISIISNLAVNHNDLIAWTREDSFPIKTISQEAGELLKDIVAIFVAFEGNQAKKIIDQGTNIYDFIFKEYDKFIDNFLSQFPTPSYLIVTEQGMRIKNRVRSYKGLLSKEIKDTSLYLEIEIPIRDNYTIIAAIIEFTDQNRKILIGNHLNNYTSCILNSFDKSFFSEKFLREFPQKYMCNKDASTINFLSLILDLCHDKKSICRVGGDGGDQELSFQIFCKETIKDLLFMQVENSL